MKIFGQLDQRDVFISWYHISLIKEDYTKLLFKKNNCPSKVACRDPNLCLTLNFVPKPSPFNSLLDWIRK
jgi:hypothetical protein